MRFYRLLFLFFYSTKVITNLLYSNSGDNMRKRFKRKKKFNIKFVFIPLIILIFILFFCYLNNNINISFSNKTVINNIFESNNKYSYIGIDNSTIIENLHKYLKENIINSPVNLLKSQLNVKTLEKQTVSFMYSEPKQPLIYIYNSHQGETYSQEYLEEYNITPDILMASKMLKEKLENIGINTIVEESDILAYMKENNLNHAGSYEASRYFLTSAIEKYPTVELFIDLHRDAGSHDVTTVNINGKNCAKVLFVIGLENLAYEGNLSIVTNINNIILEKYPTLTRGIIKKEGYGVNGVYNQDLASNVILIEIGGNENNIEEVNNTLDLIAEVIGEYLNEKNY